MVTLQLGSMPLKKALSSGDNTSKTEKLEKDYSIKVNWFGSRYFEKDVDIDN